MTINEKDFFHQATIRICGSLEINQALMDCYLYLKNFIPLDEMQLFLFDEEFGSMRSIAIANDSGSEKTDKHMPLPLVVKNELKKRDMPKKVAIFNQSKPDSLVLKILNILGHPDSSLMILPLMPDGVRIGAVIMLAKAKAPYSDFHAHLISMLHDPFAIAMSNILRHEDVLKLNEMLSDYNRYLTQEMQQMKGDEIVGEEFGLKNVMIMAQQVAPRDNPVLILGETGVGKEVIANFIHSSSPRREGPFIKVNCGAIPESLIDSELFGHEKGAFTGAVSQKRGRFERADGGTIFLDEIGDLPLQAQVRLLRVIQQKEIERVGGTKTIIVDTRIIAATHRNLEQMVDDNKFREDLWYRLNIFPITIPPLRQRKADIPALVEYFLKRKSRELNFNEIPPIAPGSIDRLIDYPWKGNVRELENMVERALIQYRGGLLNFNSFIYTHENGNSLDFTVTSTETLSLDDIFARHIKSVLKATNGKINGHGGAADLVGMHPSTLRHKMDKLGIQYGRKK